MNSVVAAPHTIRKHEEFECWAAATSGYDRLLALEASEASYAADIWGEWGIPYVLFEPVETPRRQGRHRICGPLFNQAWSALLDGATGYSHVLSLDTDVVPDGDILGAMESAYDGSVCFLRHGVPWREAYHRPGQFAYETSCTFGSIEAWRAALDKVQELGGLATLYGVVGDPDLFTHEDVRLLTLHHLESYLPERKDA